MSTGEIILALIGSGVLTSIITYFSTKYSLVKSHKAKYIIEERQKWREDVKEKVTEFCSTDKPDTKMKIKHFMFLSLNPKDEEDRKIIKDMENIINSKTKEEEKGEVKNLELRVALLLKHDWERAKNEAKGNESKEFDRAALFDEYTNKF